MGCCAVKDISMGKLVKMKHKHEVKKAGISTGFVVFVPHTSACVLVFSGALTNNRLRAIPQSLAACGDYQ